MMGMLVALRDDPKWWSVLNSAAVEELTPTLWCSAAALDVFLDWCASDGRVKIPYASSGASGFHLPLGKLRWCWSPTDGIKARKHLDAAKITEDWSKNVAECYGNLEGAAGEDVLRAAQYTSDAADWIASRDSGFLLALEC